MDWYSGSKIYILDSLLLLEGENFEQQMKTLKDNLPIVYRLLKDEWSAEAGLKVAYLVLKLVFTSKNQAVVAFVTQLILNLLFYRLKDKQDQLIIQNAEYLSVDCLVRLAQEPNYGNVFLLAYVLRYFENFKDAFFVRIAEMSANRGAKLLRFIFSGALPSDKTYLSFVQNYCFITATDQKFQTFFLREIVTTVHIVNFGALFQQNYELVDYIISQKINVNELKAIMTTFIVGVSSNLYKYVALLFQCKDYYKTTLAQAYNALYNNFGILTDENKLLAIYEVAKIPLLSTLNFYVAYRQVNFLPVGLKTNYITVFVSKQLLLCHNCAFCYQAAAGLIELRDILKSKTDSNNSQLVIPVPSFLAKSQNKNSVPRLSKQKAQALNFLFQLQELVNGPVFLVQIIQKLVTEIQELASLYTKQK